MPEYLVSEDMVKTPISRQLFTGSKSNIGFGQGAVHANNFLRSSSGRSVASSVRTRQEDFNRSSQGCDYGQKSLP